MDLNYKAKKVENPEPWVMRGEGKKFEKAAATGKPVFMFLRGDRRIANEAFYAMPDGTVQIDLRPSGKVELKKQLKGEEFRKANPIDPNEEIPF